MRVELIPQGGYRWREKQDDVRTDVFCALGRLLGQWVDDPDRLAVAVYAYVWAGWTDPAFELESALGQRFYDYERWPRWHHGERDPRALLLPDCWELIRSVMRGRHERVLRLRAEGLLLALEATAGAFEFERLHSAQVDSAVIECRELGVEERLDKLRAKAITTGG